MEIKKSAQCGNFASSDILVSIEPNEGKGIEISLESTVQVIFGDAITETVKEVLEELEVHDAKIRLQDKGALDCVIRARVQAAVLRAGGQHYDWTKEDVLWQAV